MTDCISKALRLSLLWGIASGAAAFANPPAEGNDYTVPYINPQQDCLTEGMINPAGKNYRYLFSRDCRVVHILPPPIMKQNIQSEGVNLRACAGVNSARDSINKFEKLTDQLSGQLIDLEMKLAKARPGEEKAIEAKIRETQKRHEEYSAAKTQALARFNNDYGQMPGAVFSIALDGDLSQNDINEVRALNGANLHRRRTVVEVIRHPDGREEKKTREEVDISTLRPAAMAQSYFSFIYNLPVDSIVNAGVISTEMPGLPYLVEQTGGRTGVVHIRASGGVSGKLIMSVTTACDRTKKNAEGKLVLDESTNPFFTVNRTFAIQQMFAQGYEASLKIDKVVDQITKHTVTHTEQGFKKSDVFLPSIRANVTELLDFKWVTQFDNGKNVSTEKILEIQNSVAGKLIDDYMEKLVQQGVLTTQTDPKVDPVNGGLVDETRTGHRCWTEKDGGISGVLGRRHKVCGDYTYTVKVWRDGITEQEIRRHLTLKTDERDSMQMHTTAPFYFTTAFTK